MAEIFFYHLQRQPIEAVLPKLVLKSRERGWRVSVQMITPERLAALDDHLWTYTDESFLPHGPDGDSFSADQPVLLTLQGGNANGSSIRFLLENAPIPADAGQYERLIVLFDGTDPDALVQVRNQWRESKEAGHEATYWQQDDSGRWDRKA